MLSPVFGRLRKAACRSSFPIQTESARDPGRPSHRGRIGAPLLDVDVPTFRVPQPYKSTAPQSPLGPVPRLQDNTANGTAPTQFICKLESGRVTTRLVFVVRNG